MAFTLPDLPYSHDALAAGGMSRETLEYHHDKHHKAYVDKLNELIAGTEWENASLEEIVKGTYKDGAVAQNGMFKKKFSAEGVAQFGSGWVWLVRNGQGGLEITRTENGVNPLCKGQTALLGCDVWEHSYYIDFRNARPKYLENFLENLVNWENVASRM